MTQNGFQSKPLILDMILDMIYRKFEGKVLGVPERSGLSVTIRRQDSVHQINSDEVNQL